MWGSGGQKSHDYFIEVVSEAHIDADDGSQGRSSSSGLARHADEHCDMLCTHTCYSAFGFAEEKDEGYPPTQSINNTNPKL